ncbi:MAG: hypothetical protein BIFFINMI_00711 [Phycisphaerae bacterium]|nr:hypothetical protein [Phycisphaerae bacterium]
MDPGHIEAELRRRADRFLPQRRLIVDYYRVRRRLAYPLPVAGIRDPRYPLRDRDGHYPWAIWLLWSLEERINALGWTGELLGAPACRRAACDDLAALAAWPTWRELDKPDLSSGHAGRLLVSARADWDWLGDALRTCVDDGLARLVEDIAPLADARFGPFDTPEAVLSADRPHERLHNIPLIGTIGAAMAARAIGHPAGERLDRHVETIVRAMLLHRARAGFTEAVGYDGYVNDFMAPWLAGLEAERRDGLLDHPQFARMLDESIMLAAPGAAMEVAPLGDVEPRQMPFHASAHARHYRLRPTDAAAWYLDRCPPDRLPAGALGQLHPVAAELAARAEAPRPGALDAHYALVLRTGWEAGDLAVAMAESACPMGHIHHDSGTLLIGTGGGWLLTDPGYQQYSDTSERKFTLNESAHNAPVINGQSQSLKAPRRLALGRDGRRLHAALDLTACYPPQLGLSVVRRHVWLADGVVVVADRVRGSAVRSIVYHWHGNEEAAWWVDESSSSEPGLAWARIVAPEASLCLTSPNATIGEPCIDRLRGSRGQLTLVAAADVAAPAIWWVFAPGDTPPRVVLADGGRALAVAGETFDVPE